MLHTIIVFKLMLISQAYGQLNWQSANDGVSWSLACDFIGMDLSSAQIPGDQCGAKCMSTTGCTHFAWTTWQGGSCWLKQGNVQKSDAKFTSDNSMVCGIVPTGSPGPSNGFRTFVRFLIYICLILNCHNLFFFN